MTKNDLFFACEYCDGIHFHEDLMAMGSRFYSDWHSGDCPACRKYGNHHSEHDLRKIAMARFTSNLYHVTVNRTVRGHDIKNNHAFIYPMGNPRHHLMPEIQDWRNEH